MSDFDENDIIQAPASDFDDADIVAEAAPAREPDNYVEASAQSTDPVGDATRGVMGGALGAGAGYVVNKGLELGVNAAVNNVGALRPEDIAKIDKNRDLYKSLPANSLEDMMSQFHKLGDDLRTGGIKAATDARESLKGKPAVPVSVLNNIVADSIKSDRYTKEMGQGVKESLVAEELDNIKPQRDEITSRLAEIETEAKTPAVNERQLLNQNIRDAKINKKLDQLKAPAEANAKLPIIDNHDLKRDNRKLQRIDEKLANAEAKQLKSLEDLQKKKEDFIYLRDNRLEKNSATRAIDSKSALSKTAAKKDDLLFTKKLNDIKTAETAAINEKARLEKLMAEKAELENKLKLKTEAAQAKAADKFSAKRQIPEKIVQTDPEYFGNRKLADSYVEPVAEALRETDDLDNITPERLGTFLRETRDEKIKYGQGGEINNFNKELSKRVDAKLKEIDSDYRAGMEQSHKTRLPQNLLKESANIDWNDDLDRVIFNDASKSRINQTLIDPEKNSVRYSQLKEALDESNKLGYLPENTSVEDMMTKAEVSALKNEVNRLRKGGDINAFDVNSIAKGEYSRTPGIVAKMGGTRLQELFGLYKSSKAGNAIKALGNTGLPVAGGLAAGMSAANAYDSGELSPEAAVLAGTAEAFNPAPGLDMVEGAKGGARGIDQAFAENSQEELTAQPTLGPDDLGGADLVTQNPLVQKALSGFAEGSVSQIPSMVKGAAEALDKHGFQASNDARARMEQNLNVTTSAPKAKESVPHEDFRTFVEQRPEQIQELAQLFSNDEKTASFVAPLEKAAQADDRTRSAVLFGLYQQPAFRQSLKGKRGM